MSRLLLGILLALLTTAAFAGRRQAAGIRVHVLDPRGAPIEQARVATFEDSQAGTATTDSEGWCELAFQPERAPAFRMRVEAAGFFHQDSLHTRVTELEVVLLPSAKLAGRVLDADTHEPVPGALVEFVHPSCRECAPEQVLSDELGRYAFAAVPIRFSKFFVSSRAHAKQIFAVALEGSEAKNDFELERGYELRGRILDSESGVPIAGARIATRSKAQEATTSDAAGNFALRVLPEQAIGRVNLEAQAEGFCKLRFDVRSADAPRALELKLFRPAFIEGVVVDARGEPLAGAEVSVREYNNWIQVQRASLDEYSPTPFDALPFGWFVASGHPNHQVLADAQGRFRTQGVVPWSPKVLLQVEHAAAPRFSRDVGPIGAPGSKFDTRLTPPDEPVGARVTGTLRVNGEIVLGSIAWKGATRSGQAPLDSKGAFEATAVEYGEVELRPVALRSRAMSFGSLFDGESARVSVSEKQDAQHVFELRCELTSLGGSVLTTRGKPCLNVAVTASEAVDGTRGNATTLTDGSFEILMPKVAGPWRVSALRGSELLARSNIGSGGRVEFEVAELRPAFARFVDQKTRALIVPSSLTWRRKGDARFQIRDLVLGPVDGEGQWFPLDVPEGELELIAWTPQRGYLPTPLQSLAVSLEGPPPRLEFELATGFGVDLELAPDSAAPIREDSERVWLLEAWPAFFADAPPPWNKENIALPTYADRTRRVVFDATNRARVGGLQPGRHRFVSYSSKVRIEPAEIEIREADQRCVVRVVRDE